MIVSNPEEILAKVSKYDFRQLVELANRFEPLDVEKICEDYDNGNPSLRHLQARWETSLREGSPDYSVYGDPAYLNESFVCWKGYARRYIKLLQKYVNSADSEIDTTKVRTVLDLGCGCAYSTVGLKAVFPNAKVYGTNLPGTLQFAIDETVTANIEGCHILDEEKTLSLPSVNMVFASEFFEHLTNPIDLLARLMDKYKPEYFVFANTFNKMSIGHFPNYSYDGEVYSGDKMSRIFGTYLRHHRYKKVYTRFFNGRPTIYKRVPDKFTLHRLFEVNV